MKQFNVSDVVGHGSITEYSRMLERVKRRSLWMRIAFGGMHLLIAVLNWRNPLLCLWVALAYYYFWNGENWMVEAFEARIEHTKDLLRQIERGKTIKRKLYE